MRNKKEPVLPGGSRSDGFGEEDIRINRWSASGRIRLGVGYRRSLVATTARGVVISIACTGCRSTCLRR